MTPAPHNPRIVAGLDNGLASGALVVIDRLAPKFRERVLAAVSLVEPRGVKAAADRQAREIAETFGGVHDKEFTSAHIRAGLWVARFSTALDEIEAEFGPVEVFGVEAFDDQAQHAKKLIKGRWKTPLLLGRLAVELEGRGITVENGRLVYQNAGIVLKQFKDELQKLAARQTKTLDMVRPNDRTVTNEHQRSAFSHACALSLRLGAATTTPTTVPTIAA